MPSSFYVTDYGVELAPGESSQDVLLACMAELPLLQTAEDLLLNDESSGEMHQPVLLRYASNPELLSDTAYQFLKKTMSVQTPVLFVFPDEEQPQQALSIKTFQDLAQQPGLYCLKSSQLEQAFSQHLAELEQESIESLTLFAIDTLVSLPVLTESLQAGNLRTKINCNGRAAGEGWGWFTLQSKKPEESPAIQWQPGKWVKEPAPEREGSKEYKGLALSMAPLIDNCPPLAGLAWICSRRQTSEDDLEAFMAFQYHWGNRNFKYQEQICLAKTLGDLGVAALPIAVAIACERLAFGAFPKDSALVSHSQMNGIHYSLLLSKNRTFS